jgi:hypothetical protein
MVSKRQRRVKAHRKARDMAKAYMTEAFHKIAEEIRKESFRSLVDLQKEIDASVSRDKESINPEADTPGQVGNGFIGVSSCKDIYADCFPEDLDWASEMMKRRKI